MDPTPKQIRDDLREIVAKMPASEQGDWWHDLGRTAWNAMRHLDASEAACWTAIELLDAKGDALRTAAEMLINTDDSVHYCPYGNPDGCDALQAPDQESADACCVECVLASLLAK